MEGIFRRGLDVLASLATTSRAMDKWMLQLDSACQKGPETTLEGVLIVLVSSAQNIRGFKSDQAHHCRFSVNDKGADQHLHRFSVNDTRHKLRRR